MNSLAAVLLAAAPALAGTASPARKPSYQAEAARFVDYALSARSAGYEDFEPGRTGKTAPFLNDCKVLSMQEPGFPNSVLCKSKGLTSGDATKAVEYLRAGFEGKLSKDWIRMSQDGAHSWNKGEHGFSLFIMDDPRAKDLKLVAMTSTTPAPLSKRRLSSSLSALLRRALPEALKGFRGIRAREDAADEYTLFLIVTEDFGLGLPSCRLDPDSYIECFTPGYALSYDAAFEQVKAALTPALPAGTPEPRCGANPMKTCVWTVPSGATVQLLRGMFSGDGLRGVGVKISRPGA
jgi:hypothetical protein